MKKVRAEFIYSFGDNTAEVRINRNDAPQWPWKVGDYVGYRGYLTKEILENEERYYRIEKIASWGDWHRYQVRSTIKIGRVPGAPMPFSDSKIWSVRQTTPENPTEITVE